MNQPASQGTAGIYGVPRNRQQTINVLIKSLGYHPQQAEGMVRAAEYDVECYERDLTLTHVGQGMFSITKD